MGGSGCRSMARKKFCGWKVVLGPQLAAGARDHTHRSAFRHPQRDTDSPSLQPILLRDGTSGNAGRSSRINEL